MVRNYFIFLATVWRTWREIVFIVFFGHWDPDTIWRPLMVWTIRFLVTDKLKQPLWKCNEYKSNLWRIFQWAIPHFFLHFAVHRADCLQILRDKSQLGLRGADSIVEENVSSANISSLAHKSHHLPKIPVSSSRLAIAASFLTKSVSQAYLSHPEDNICHC